MKNYEYLYRLSVNKIRELEELLSQQAIELHQLGKASFEVHAEDSQQLADFKTTNKNLIEFVEKVADSKSKYGKEARKILGR